METAEPGHNPGMLERKAQFLYIQEDPETAGLKFHGSHFFGTVHRFEAVPRP